MLAYVRFAWLASVLSLTCHETEAGGVEKPFINIKPNIRGPQFVDRPFVLAWQVPTDGCERDFGIKIDLKRFSILHNPSKGFSGDTLVIFYGDNIGAVPRFDKNSKPVHGGLPQSGDLNAHLKKAASDISTRIPDKKFRGLAVVDWESWHALFDRESSQTIYHKKSVEKVQKEHPEWTPEQQVAWAKYEYNAATKAFMLSTLALGKLLRPSALWGFYLYPNCYNYNITGKDFSCPKVALKLNDEIEWLFDESTGIYPSVYLNEWFKDKEYAAEYVANRIREAMRVEENRQDNTSVPVFPYHMISYKKESTFLDQLDLRHSIGMASILGTSGMVIWGGYNVANSKESCKKLSNYVNLVLGPFCKRTSDAAALCSKKHCSAHGRCVVASKLFTNQFVPSDTSIYRYPTVLEAANLLKSSLTAAYEIYDVHRIGYEKLFKQFAITCQCYNLWTGADCSIPRR